MDELNSPDDVVAEEGIEERLDSIIQNVHLSATTCGRVVTEALQTDFKSHPSHDITFLSMTCCVVILFLPTTWLMRTNFQ